MEEKLRTKETENWVKCWFAMQETRDAISKLASGLFEKFYIHIRGILHDDHHISVQKTCTTCRDPKQGCSVCSKICHLICDSHRFKDVNLKGPSWNNTDSTQWCTNSWELAKCYMPSTGYKDKPSADNTDFNGIINALYNCIWMQNFFADDLRLDNNICTEARKQVNKLRHMHSTNIADDGMISFFDCLLNLLNDARHLKGFKPAVDARIYLIELKQDTLQLSEKMINDTWTKHFEDKKEEFRIDLIEHYRKTKSTVSISPMTEGLDKPIVDVFVSPILMHIATEKNGCRRQTGNTVKQYKHIFFNDSTHHNRVFIQGEPGMGKTTFCAKLVLDWCEAVSSENHEYRATFSDLETLKEFGFLFSIALRDSEGQNEVVKMVKRQIIDMIYTENERTDIYNLLQNIMKNELCIVVMDGLNEWVDPSKKHVIPIMVSYHKKCVALISTRPWKMTDERIKDSEIDLLLEVAGITDSDELTKNMLRCLQNANLKTYTDLMSYVEERQLLQFIASPWLQSLLVNLWMDNTALSGSLCELNCLLLDRLFKKANAKHGYFPEEHPIQCLSNTRSIEPQKEILYALGKAAFYFTCSSEKSLVFTKRQLLNFVSEEHFQFCLNAGVLTEKHATANSQISFVHETIQEFLAAFHIAHSKEDIFTSVLSKHKYNVLELSQTIVYLCGLQVAIANKAIQFIISSEFLSDVNDGLSGYIQELYLLKSLVYEKDANAIKNGVISNIDTMNSIVRSLALHVSFQRLLIASYMESKASKLNGIYPTCHDFIFNQYLNKTHSSVLKVILMKNKSNVRTLMTEKTLLQKSEVLSVIQESTHCLERLEIPTTPELCNALRCSNIKELAFIGAIDASLVSKLILSMSNLTYLKFKKTSLKETIHVPTTVQSVCLLQCECSLQFFKRFLVEVSALKHKTSCYLIQISVIDCKVPDLQTDILQYDMSNMALYVNKCSFELYNLLRGASIGELTLETGDVELTSDILPTITSLGNLYLCSSHTCNVRCTLNVPPSLRRVTIYKGEYSHEWVSSLFIKLSALNHHVKCTLWDINVTSTAYSCGVELSLHVSDIKSKLILYDLSNIELFVKTESHELFEIVRDTGMTIARMVTPESLLQASSIILSKLKKLYIKGRYVGRFDLHVPVFFKLIYLDNVECSSEWFFSALITLSSLHRPVQLHLEKLDLQPSKENSEDDIITHVSDLRSEFLSCDMSNISLSVGSVNIELFEVFRDSSLRLLKLQSADIFSQALDIIPTLRKLEGLHLMGTLMDRCELQLPASLKLIHMDKVKCSPELLCNLLMTLSSFDHPVVCDLEEFVLQSINKTLCAVSDTQISSLRSQLLSTDMSNIILSLENINRDLFEIIRDSSLKALLLKSADCVSQASELIPTLSKLEKLNLMGTFMSRCDLQLTVSLQLIRVCDVECSSEWLCSLLIALSSFKNPVVFELNNVVLQSSYKPCCADSDTRVSDLRSKLLSSDMSNVSISVKSVNIDLFQILRESSLKTLILTSADCVLQASDILPTLSKLEVLELFGIYAGRFDLNLPVALQCIRLEEIECSSEWLCSLLIALSSFNQKVVFELNTVVLQSSHQPCCEDSDTRVSDLRSELLSSDMSNITVSVKSVNKDLFQILRESSLKTLKLTSADCVLQASDILPTLRKLEALYLSGTYAGRFALNLPVTLKFIILQEIECSSEWLCSLLIALSSFNQKVVFELNTVVLQSSYEPCCADSDTQASDLRSELLSSDLSNIKVAVEYVNKDLFQIFRDSSLTFLVLKSADCVSQASDICFTLSNLKVLLLEGTYAGCFDLNLPVKLQCISLQKVECSSEWLCSLLLTIFSFNRPLQCQLRRCVLQSNTHSRGGNTMTHDSDLRSEFVEYNVFNKTIIVENGSMELFEVLRSVVDIQ